MSIRERALSVSTVATVSAALLAVGTAGAKPGAPYIRYGASGITAYCVQVGVDHARTDRQTTADLVSQDGKFGPAALGALQQLQHDFGLSPDGVVGPDTGFGAYAGHCYQVLPTHG
ncbi:peptidoglycan-binding protein [Streptomyces sp. NPDC059835]|uniref:peptidoglycan-binding domain-containing protein n=1 Tax=Streptomyces sp. NPDC059835 TaxID=3346967 RepID=UPI00364A585E